MGSAGPKEGDPWPTSALNSRIQPRRTTARTTSARQPVMFDLNSWAEWLVLGAICFTALGALIAVHTRSN